MRLFALIVTALTLSIGSAEGEPSTQNSNTDQCSYATASQFRKVAKQVYQPWYQPRGKRSRLLKLKGCAQNTLTLKQMREIQAHLSRGRFASISYYRALTPYTGGGARWAIPYPIVYCESGTSGLWKAANPSGAQGPYQLLGHGQPWPVDSMADKMEHHEIARGFYVDLGTGPWVASIACWG